MEQERWLKALGTSQDQMPDDWRQITVLRGAATFGRKPSVKRGDKIVYYATGTGIIFAAGEVTSYPYQAESPTETHWPWRVDVRLDIEKDFIHDGAPLEHLNVDGRNLRKSIRQQSHVRLSEAEYDAALAALS